MRLRISNVVENFFGFLPNFFLKSSFCQTFLKKVYVKVFNDQKYSIDVGETHS